MTTDLFIIGAGPGGYETAAYAAQHGLSVVLAEEKALGGTCLNAGCIPTKSLVYDAEHYQERLSTAGRLSTAAPSTAASSAFLSALQRKDGIVAQLRQGVAMLMKQAGVTVVEGHATLKDAPVKTIDGTEYHTVTVNGEDYEAKDIILATGSSPKMPPLPGLGRDGTPLNSHVVTSTEILALDHLPQSLCIIGAGVIGMEIASVLAAFGTEVTIVEFLRECLPAMDQEIAKRLRKLMEKRGITFHLGCAVNSVEDAPATAGRLSTVASSLARVTFTDQKKGRAGTVDAELVLVATGRQPNTGGLGLEALGIAVDRRGITTTDDLEASLPHVYAIGDVNGRMMLAHAASFQGKHVVNRILGREDHIRLDIIPAAVFTDPEAACVGLTEEQAKALGIAVTTHKAIYRSNGRALTMNATDGLLKLVCDDKDRIIGCHAFGVGAASLVQEVAALMNFDVTRQRLRDIVHIHPTIAELLIG